MTREEIIKLAREKFACQYSKLPIAEFRIEDFFQAAYDAGASAEREACAQVADRISEDQWALYKGRPPYTGKELERASDYTQGKSDGAEVCAAAIRARKD